MKKEFFGPDPSDFGLRSADTFQKCGFNKILELGCGQGRDTVMFLRKGFDVTATDFCQAGIDQVNECASCNGLVQNLKLLRVDMKEGLPFADGTFDAVYSHMLFTMQFTEKELAKMMDDVRRVLKPGGYNIYSVRSDLDPQYQKGKHFGEDMYQNPLGFIVHFYTEDKIKRLSRGWDILAIRRSVEGSHPFDKHLYEVTMRKPR